MVKSNGMSSISTAALISSKNVLLLLQNGKIQDAFPPVFSKKDVPTVRRKEITVKILDDPFSTAHNYGHVYHGTVSSQ